MKAMVDNYYPWFPLTLAWIAILALCWLVLSLRQEIRRLGRKHDRLEDDLDVKYDVAKRYSAQGNSILAGRITRLEAEASAIRLFIVNAEREKRPSQTDTHPKG